MLTVFAYIAALSCLEAAASPAQTKPKAASGADVSITSICGPQEPDLVMLNEIAGIYNSTRSIDRKLAASAPGKAEAARLAARRRRLMWRLLALSDSHIGSYSAQICLARILLSLSEPEKALAVAERAVRLAPRDMRTIILRGMARLKAGDREGAKRDAEEVLRESPQNKGAADLFRLAAGRPYGETP